MTSIITVPNPLLRKKSVTVLVNEETLNLVEELKQTVLRKEGIKGIGLSAIQIGFPKRIFIAYSNASKKFLIFINPEIIWYSKYVTEGVPDSPNKYEGCLSVPNVWAIIRRSKAIKIRYQTPSGQTQVRKFKGLAATIIQHEYDHLNGILFVQRALEQRSKIYQLQKNKEGKEFLEEVTFEKNV